MPYHCPSDFCSAVGYIVDRITDKGGTVWGVVSCSSHHVLVRKLSDLNEITNLYWPAND